MEDDIGHVRDLVTVHERFTSLAPRSCQRADLVHTLHSHRVGMWSQKLCGRSCRHPAEQQALQERQEELSGLGMMSLCLALAVSE